MSGGALNPETQTARGYAAPRAKARLEPYSFERRRPGARDVEIEIHFCGICHSDIHQARDEWGGAIFPMVPGHEIAGRVRSVGKAVTRHREGDWVGVGCMVNSCRTCDPCRAGLEQYCEPGANLTYNSHDRDGSPTYGGYSDHIVVDEDFVLAIRHDPKQLAAVAPLLCAGITTYSPLRHWKVAAGAKVGVVGLGGLGHVAVKLAHALGAETVLFTRTAAKTADAKRLGANAVVLSTDESALQVHQRSFDFILDTVAAAHDVNRYLSLLRRDGVHCLVGVPDRPLAVAGINLIMRRRSLVGSLIGGIAETQEMLDFCAYHEVVSDVEVIPIEQVNEAYERVLRSDVRYRFSIDMKSLGAAAPKRP
ncbi:MAG: NAD(P)-dependent alcohol dehydrogenase [Terriglobales bacterium]